MIIYQANKREFLEHAFADNIEDGVLLGTANLNLGGNTLSNTACNPAMWG